MPGERRPAARSDDLPSTPVQLTGYLARLAVESDVVGSWSKTLQLGLLILLPAGALAVLVIAVVVVAVYVKLDPREWALVGSCVLAAVTGTSVLAVVGRRAVGRSRRRDGGKDAEEGETPAA